MYTDINFKSKKQLKDRVAARLAYLAAQKLAAETGPMTVGAVLASAVRPVGPVTVFQPNDMFGNPAAKPDYSGTACVEGPHYPEPHKWYAQVTIEKGEVVKVK
jgi:hypothetical protein